MKTALVTGASGGIGRATVEALLSRGHRVLAVSRQARALTALGDGVVPVEAELSTEDGRARIAAAVSGPLDVLVHVAGVNPREPLASMR